MGGADRALAEPLLPLPFHEHVAVAKASPAIDAFARRRAAHIVKLGHTSESDLTKPPGYLARQARGALTAFTDIVGPFRMDVPPARRCEALNNVEAAGALLIALWERLQVEVPEA